MNRKDIALTVGGVLATMALAYLFYRLQQRDAAAIAAANEAAANDASNAAASDPYNNQLTEEWLAANLTQAAQTPLTGTTTNIPAAVNTSGAVADLGSYYDSTDTSHLLSDIVAEYGAPVTPLNLAVDQFNAVTLPALAGVTQTATGNIPVTAGEALAQAEAAISPSSPSYDLIPTIAPTSSFLDSMVSSPLVTSHPVQAHPIVSVGQ
jgi:hypothetical protein